MALSLHSCTERLTSPDRSGLHFNPASVIDELILSVGPERSFCKGNCRNVEAALICGNIYLKIYVSCVALSCGYKLWLVAGEGHKAAAFFHPFISHIEQISVLWFV